MPKEYDPEAPAFGEGSQKPEDLEEQIESKENAEVKVETETSKKETEETPEEESKVPYSRFKKFHEEAKKWEAEAKRLQAEVAERKEPVKIEKSTEVPEFWKELYGDSEASQRAWIIQSKANQDLIETAKHEAREAIKAETQAEKQRVEKNLETIENGLESLNDYAGRILSEAEQESVMDIIDDFSPKDGDGNYIANISFEKAFDIYEAKQGSIKANKTNSRNKVASALNAKTQGTPSDEQVERNKNFNPLDWSAAAKRIN